MDNLLAWGILALATFSGAIAVGVALYHAAFLAVAACCRKPRRCEGAEPAHSFAIVVPAHDEEATIVQALECCESLDYPETLRRVYVVADNCSDGTAEVAERRGAICLVRHDEQRRGKGHALAWALPRVLADGCDAVLVLDADCRIDRHALRVFDAELSRGGRVLQASYVVANPDENARSYVLALANVLENDCFYAPKSALGLAVFLRGTGMVLHRDVLQRFPWQAGSIVEDVEYACELIEGGERIRFVPEVRVISDFPVRAEQLAVQRRRWIGGGAHVAIAWVPRFVRQSLRTGRPALLDAAVTLMVLGRPLVLTQLLASLAVALVCHAFWPGIWTKCLLLACAAVAGWYVLYAGVGVLRLGLSRKRAALLVRLPWSIAEYLVMAVRAVAQCNPTRWERTPRGE
ncbi:MAG: glycosyltransferase family 2 protein [Thermoguttaceae bacterium]